MFNNVDIFIFFLVLRIEIWTLVWKAWFRHLAIGNSPSSDSSHSHCSVLGFHHFCSFSLSLSSTSFVFSLVHGGGFRRPFAFWVPKAPIKPQKASSRASLSLQSLRFPFILSLSSCISIWLSLKANRLLFKRVFLSLFSPLLSSGNLVFALNIWFLWFCWACLFFFICFDSDFFNSWIVELPPSALIQAFEKYWLICVLGVLILTGNFVVESLDKWGFWFWSFLSIPKVRFEFLLLKFWVWCLSLPWFGWTRNRQSRAADECFCQSLLRVMIGVCIVSLADNLSLLIVEIHWALSVDAVVGNHT